jgi:D-alanyl-D-alanine carboxypeptidase
MHFGRLVLALGWALAATSAAASWASAPLDVAKLDRALDGLEAHQRLQGSVAIGRAGKVIYSRAFGLRDGRAENDPETMFRIGSITKVFTAALVYQLIDEGRLALATPLGDYYPQITNADRITIAHLLAHTSGLPNFPSPAEAADPHGWLHRPQSKRQMLARFAAMKAEALPGERLAYSNVNYVLLGYIVEAVTHSTYKRQLLRRITRPLGLDRTRFGGRVNAARNEAKSYDFDDGRWLEHPEESLTVAAGAGAVVSTPRDLVRFASALFEGGLIRPGSVREMTTPFSPSFDGAERKGVVVSTLRRGVDKTIYSHLGGIDGFRSNLVYFPADRIAIAITLNGQNYPMGRLFWLLADAAFRLDGAVPAFDPVALPDETLAQYEGVYSLAAIGMDLTVEREGGHLRARATGQEWFSIEAIAAPSPRFDALFWDRSGILLEFRRDPQGKVLSVALFQGRSEMSFLRQ